MHLRRRTFTTGLGLALAVPAIRRVRAAPVITVGYTATLSFNGAFIAKDRGFFEKHGLNVELQLIALNSNIPGAIMGGSVQIGGPTPTVMLQANDGGLDLVIVSGCAGIDANNKTDGLMVRKGANITKAADCIGKKIGVPGLNAYYHVLVRKWLNDNGVDWRRVNFVEVAFTQSADVLRSGSVDAVATGEPFSQRIVADGIGTLLVPGSTIAPAGTPNLFYSATRDWVTGQSRRRAGLPPGRLPMPSQFQAADPAGCPGQRRQVHQTTARGNGHHHACPSSNPPSPPAQVGFWIDLMAQQDMIQDKPDPSKLLIP